MRCGFDGMVTDPFGVVTVRVEGVGAAVGPVVVVVPGEPEGGASSSSSSPQEIPAPRRTAAGRAASNRRRLTRAPPRLGNGVEAKLTPRCSSIGVRHGVASESYTTNPRSKAQFDADISYT